MNNSNITRITQDGNTTIFHLDSNHSIGKIILQLSAKKPLEIEASYAVNGITSDLISIGRISAKNDGTATLAFAVPILASHLFFTLPEAIEVQELDFEEDMELSGENTYPRYQDFPLEKNYYLDSVTVFTPEEGYTQYTLYTSSNGRDFEELARKTATSSCPKEGETYPAKGREASIIRVYLEYCSSSPNAVVTDLTFTGKESGHPVMDTPPVEVADFEDSIYNQPVTQEDTYEEIRGIIRRRLGEAYLSWFSFQLEKNPVHRYDYFSLEDDNGKVLIKGNNGVSLATGLNYYLKHFCKVHLSQLGDQVAMPTNVLPVNTPVFRETKAKVRYAYNYCTFSYTMPFWGEKEWTDELDWLALSGVNLVLDIVAQEEVWRRFLGKLGYSHQEIKKYIAGPGYYAWAYMANLSGFGGPVHDSWFSQRTELARSNQLRMRRLGMETVLQGYSGMVPVDICDHDKDAEILPQGCWGSLQRPSMLQTTSKTFRRYAEKFYQAQREVYGNHSHHYATDPFHEGGKIGTMSLRSIAKEVLSAMLEADPDSIWLIQAWEGNPKSELLMGLTDVPSGKSHALVLDLYAEKIRRHLEGGSGNESYGYAKEFDGTPWIFCMLNNFGGRLGMHGHLNNLQKNIPEALNTCNHIQGIGITPEASMNNPVLYDFLFDIIWQENADAALPVIDLEDWLSAYTTRRYGRESGSCQKAWRIFQDTVYASQKNMLGQGAPESVVNARPALKIQAASTWGNSIISYDKQQFASGVKLLLEDFDTLKDNKAYLYDAVTAFEQVLSNAAQDYHRQMAKAFEAKDKERFGVYAKAFLSTIDRMESVTSASEYYLLGRWVEQAKALAENTDDFSKRLYELNAKALITTWGAFATSEISKLRDYSNRQWSGLIGDFYKPRWEKWIAAQQEVLDGKESVEIPYFAWEWNWVRRNQTYPTSPSSANLNALWETFEKTKIE